jgi:hypothetical protein
MTEFIFVTNKDFSIRAQEVVRELDKKAYVLLRVGVVGPHFPHRDSYPFVRIVSEDGTVESLMAEVSTDQKELRGYFPTDAKLTGRVEFGYASQVLGSIPIRRIEASKLDSRRIEADVHRIKLRDLGPFKRSR